MIPYRFFFHIKISSSEAFAILIESFECILVLDLIPFPAIKLPKLKKLRQWSHDLTNLTHFTNRNSNAVDPKSKTSSESSFPTNGISTISSAIREQRIDPKRDNLGLYALKCDRSSSVANARRGVLLNLPTTMIKTKAEINSFQSIERNHEAFKSCERISDPTSGIMYDGATSSGSGAENKVKIEAPPRRKKRQTATRNIISHPKQTNPKPNLKQASVNVVKTESLDKNDNGLYRSLNAGAETAKISVEEPKKKEHVVTMVKPKVQKAVAVKAKPVQQQVAKVKSYEWNKHQRKSSVTNLAKPHKTGRYLANENSRGSFNSNESVDIFQSNQLKHQRKLFDEFDALFDKSKDSSGNIIDSTPATALSRLNALKFPSSSFSDERGFEVKANHQATKKPVQNISNVKSSQDFPLKNHTGAISPTKEHQNMLTRPKIVYEQPKAPTSIIKKKILYYDDKQEIKQLIMNQTQSTTIINNHFSGAALPTSEGNVPIACSPQSIIQATGQFDLNGNDASEDYRHSSNNQKAREANSNSLRIFSNEGVFVFNL